MNAIKHNRNIIAMTMAAGLVLAGNSALAMTTEHDTRPANERSGTAMAQDDSRLNTDGHFVYVGSDVGYVLMPSGAIGNADRPDADDHFVDVGGHVGYVLLPTAIN